MLPNFDEHAYIVLRDVVKEYKTGEITVRAADGITFSIGKGELAVVCGPSGAGKTTALNLLGGMDTATSGQILVDGIDIARFNKRQRTAYRRKDIGFVFQFYNLVPNLTALENVELACQICGSQEDPEKTLDSVGLLDKKAYFPSQLSGGEQQRAAIARALAKNPKLLLCDEPTGALDNEAGLHVLSLLSDISREKGMTTVIITHNLAITQIANRAVTIKSGKVTHIEVNAKPLRADDVQW